MSLRKKMSPEERKEHGHPAWSDHVLAGVRQRTRAAYIVSREALARIFDEMDAR